MITNQYKNQITALHKNDKAWGDRVKIPNLIISCIQEKNIKSILDFGCGKGNLVNSLKLKFPELEITGYDPSFHNIDKIENKVDMIISTDVLEHVEPEFIDNTISFLKSKTNICMYHLIACYPAVAVLPDGRNAHLIVEDPSWWRNKLLENELKISYEKIKDQVERRKVGNMRIIEYEVIVELK
jgi:cyclopropane fatty-acyl-phospholipid synthase-like methyltransferase